MDDRRPPDGSADEIADDIRWALTCEPGDQLNGLIVIGEVIPMRGALDGTQCMVWNIDEDMPLHRALGMVEMLKARLLEMVWD